MAATEAHAEPQPRRIDMAPSSLLAGPAQQAPTILSVGPAQQAPNDSVGRACAAGPNGFRGRACAAGPNGALTLPPARVRPRMQVVVIRDLPHVVVEEPPLRIFHGGDAAEPPLEMDTLLRRRRAPMRAEYGHRHVARIAIEDDEAKWLVELGVPVRRARQLAELTRARGHR